MSFFRTGVVSLLAFFAMLAQAVYAQSLTTGDIVGWPGESLTRDRATGPVFFMGGASRPFR